MNCLKIKKIHKKNKGSRACFSFLTTTNLMRAPATKVAIKSFNGQASGKTNTWIRAMRRVTKRETETIAAVLLRNMEVMSTK